MNSIFSIVLPCLVTMLFFINSVSSFSLPNRWLNKVASAVIATEIAFNGGIPIESSFADTIPTVGTVAPSFSLASSTGKTLTNEDLKGKWNVIYFYPGDFTQGCTLEANAFQKDIQKYKDLGANIIGVSVDSVEKHVDFSKSCNLQFTLLSDPGGVVSNKYGSLIDLGFIGKFSNRQTYIVDPEGKIRYVFTDVESHLTEHSADVLRALTSLKSS